MKKLLSTTALMFALSLSGAAHADDTWHGKDDHKGPPPFMEEALSKMPEKDAAQFRDTMKEGKEKNKALLEQVHKLHEELRDIMTAKTFDKDKYLAKSAELKKLHETLRDQMHANRQEAFVDALGKLSQDERKILADAMQKAHDKHDEHGKHHMHHGEGMHEGESDSSQSDSQSK